MKRWLQTALIGLMAIGPLSVWSEVQHMKTRTIAYWIATVFVTLIMTPSGVLAISHAPAFMKALSHLGYPPYFWDLLGVGKLIGVCVLLAPGLTKLKEWAYVAFGITALSACYSIQRWRRLVGAGALGHICSIDDLLSDTPYNSSIFKS